MTAFSIPIHSVLTACILGLTSLVQATELQLPNEIKSLRFVDRTSYDDKRLGYSLRYQNENLVKADIYVYDKGIENLQDGIDSPQAASELASVGAVLQRMQQLGKYTDVREEESGKKKFDDLKVQFLWVQHSYKQAPGEGVAFTGKRISDTFLLIHQGTFIKIRITIREDNLKLHQDEIDAVLREVAKLTDSGEKGTDSNHSGPIEVLYSAGLPIDPDANTNELADARKELNFSGQTPDPEADADDHGVSKLRKSIDKAIEPVGSERVLRLMILEANKVWDPILLKGYSKHANSGGSVYDFFLDKEKDSSSLESPYYLKLKRHDAGYKLTIGFCFQGTCGEGADFEFSNSFDLIGNGPRSLYVH